MFADTGIKVPPETGWLEQSEVAAERGTHATKPPLSRSVAPMSHERRCPHCQSIVYSRRHRLCGICAQPLPEEHLFSVSEARRIEALLAFERQQHRLWLAES
ncbi:MAG: hypothetical protein U1G07_18145 [Verrucomicrobiota bacterium]